ncbi:hypothetical protein GCE9029_02086 [Grimontia celer]|uniref:Uncharacterized protein n=1 Tax=Grimontia celer TaxID=1796497 RepID=A0A128F1C9_9GAMM|nr:hypothetical protein [Grimontia celer]CZF80603.1 hypothetical protein GCE9029_02086 [Grimontia celer]
MKDIKPIFRNLEKMLRQSSWFDDGWEIYNRGVYMQLYKENWHNEAQGGIHFETYIEAPQLKQKEFPICMHAEEDCPSQSEFVRKFLQLEGEKIKDWKGYQTIGGGYHICQRNLPLNFKNLEQKLYEEFNRLRQFEGGIEQTLSEL